jgi:hypothetical protein
VSLSGHGFEALTAIGPGKKLVAVTVRMIIDDPCQDVGEISERIDVVELAGLCRLPNYAEWFWVEPVVCAYLPLIERSWSWSIST